MTRAALLPVFALTFLTLFTGASLELTRFRAARRGEVKLKDIAQSGKLAFSEQNQKIAASYENQLEMPTLFYALVALAVPLEKADVAFVALEWLYVILRYVHAYIHMTSNYVPRRFQAFTASVATLMAMWIYFAVRILT
jgi:hypothetical protein